MSTVSDGRNGLAAPQPHLLEWWTRWQVVHLLESCGHWLPLPRLVCELSAGGGQEVLHVLAVSLEYWL